MKDQKQSLQQYFHKVKSQKLIFLVNSRAFIGVQWPVATMSIFFVRSHKLTKAFYLTKVYASTDREEALSNFHSAQHHRVTIVTVALDDTVTRPLKEAFLASKIVILD